MPKIQIQKSQGTEIRQAPVNASQVSTEAPLEAFGGGAGLEKQNNAQREILHNVQKIVVMEKAKADQLEFQDNDIKVAELQNRLEIEAAKKQGKSAAEAPDLVDGEWRKGLDEIYKGVKSKNALEKLRQSSKLRGLTLNSYVQKHTFAELDKYDTKSSGDAIENYRNDAVVHYEDTGRIEQSIIQQEQTYLGWAQRKGIISEEEINDYKKTGNIKNEVAVAGLREIHTKTHTGIITQMLSDGNSDAAVEYYEDNKDSLPPQQRLEIKRIIDEEKVELDSEKVASNILEKAGPNLGETENLLNDIKDEESRKKVKEKLDPLLRNAIEAQNEQQADIGSRLAEGTYTLADLKKDEASLPRDFVNAVQISRKNKTQNGVFKESWDSNYLSLMEKYMKISGADPENQSSSYSSLRKEILINKPKLRDNHYKELLKMSDPKYIQQNKEKSGPLSGVVDWFKQTFSGDSSKGARATEELMKKAETSSPEKLHETAKAIVDKENARNNPLAIKYKDAKTITTPGGKTLKITGYDDDGTPIVEEM